MGEFERVVSDFAAETLVPMCPGPVRTAIAGLAVELWGESCEVVVDDPCAPIVHSIDGQTWLTWSVDACGQGATRVRLLLEEEAGSGPDPDLETVLLLLLGRCLKPQEQ